VKLGRKLFLLTLFAPFLIKSEPIKLPVIPQNTILAFDLNGVVLNYDYPKLVRSLFSIQKVKLLYYLMRPSVLHRLYELLKNKTKCAEYYVEELSKVSFGLENNIDQLMEILNNQYLIQDSFSILEGLSKKNYELHIFSNIGPRSYAILNRKNPNLFAIFTKIKIADTSNPALSKPNPAAYKDYLKKAGGVEGKQIIFVDDKEKNLRIAEENGIRGLLFTKSLRETLKILNIL
jgi:FMN phosphatase YigB (HAD superfamily)